MNNFRSSRQQQSGSSSATGGSMEALDFDAWASQVKRQMIACLKKRGSA